MTRYIGDATNSATSDHWAAIAATLLPLVHPGDGGHFLGSSWSATVLPGKIALAAKASDMLKLKRTYAPAASSDGYRILVDRLWPRGLSKDKAHVDLWIKEIAPSDALRKWFGHDPRRWPAFRARYWRELRQNSQSTGELKRLLKKHRTVTLLFSARDEERNQAVALQAFLERRPPAKRPAAK